MDYQEGLENLCSVFRYRGFESHPRRKKNMAKEKILLVSAGVVHRKNLHGKIMWFVVNQNGAGWEIPKTNVRRGESSVRGVIRAMAEQAGMKVRVLEEVGRAGGATMVNGKPLTQRTLYYLMLEKGGGEILGFDQYAWLEYGKAVRKIDSQRDKQMLMKARDMVVEMGKPAYKNHQRVKKI